MKSGRTDAEYISAKEAAELLGVSRSTLYAYVSRKGLRSRQMHGSRLHRYWRPDIERVRKRQSGQAPVSGELQRESEITLLTESGPYYRGQSAIELAESASLESVAALLWDIGERDVFTEETPAQFKGFQAMDALLSGEAAVDRAVAQIQFMEQANPKSFDLSPRGMARTGADIIRWLAAVMLKKPRPGAEPIHLQFAQMLGLNAELTDLNRRLLVLSADHAFEPTTFAVRAVASTGVTPWRSVATGLSVATGRHSRFGYSDALRRFIIDVVNAGDPQDLVVHRIREGEVLPGFASAAYPHGDPRARAVLDYCGRIFARDEGFRRLKKALAVAKELRDLNPGFTLASAFAGMKLALVKPGAARGLGAAESSFLVGRTVGWVAHAIEQYKAGEAERRELLYRGPLPIDPHT